ncbi:TPA: hypothetical protein ACHTOO_000588 [Pseudomonas aeruginosa]
MSSTQHQLIEQCATRLRGIVEALDNIHDNTPLRWSTDLDDVHSSAESLLAMIKDQAPTQAAQGLAGAALAQPSPAQGVQENSGYDQLWAWFGLSRSAYAVLPRVMMHAMPDEWQGRFAELMDEWDDHWPNQPDINARVHITQNGLYISTPKWLLDYRHPDHNQLNAMRGKDDL